MRGSLSRWRVPAMLAALCVLGLGLLAGCGSGVAGSGTTDTSSTASISSSSSTSTTSTLPGTGRPPLTLGDKNTTEEFIVGELYDLALSAQGYSVTLYRNIGPPSVTYQALQQGHLNIYPEYLNVWDSQVVRDPHLFKSSDDAYVAGQTWAADHQLELLSPTPGSDTSGIAVTAAFAQANHLRTLADLGRLSTSLHLGAPIQFAQSPTGLPALEQAYGFLPDATSTIVLGDQYAELQAGKLQAAYVQTTDAQLASSAYKVLGDPRHINGFGNIVPVVTTATLAAEGAAFVNTIYRVDRLLTTPVLRQLNADVDLLHQDVVTVAKQFLIEHSLVPATTP